MTVDTPYASIRRADEAERQAVLDVLTEAFMNDPLVRWLYPETGPRGPLQAHYYRHLLTHPTAEAYLAGDSQAAAIWLTLPADHTPDEEPGGGERLRALGEALAPRHPNGERHLYLPCMGVVTGRQGAGLGSAMLRHRLERADADRLPAYLEASSPRSRALYRRHGFEDLGEPVRVAGSPPLWPMWRHPHPN
ncbi:GNAT family N-acetyltransferase [Nonomuraea endophytica]|uniref:Ribosomal protein S18 acetylase RimI-like enzyme n=1 Tax=Nonomuraea endophytica TaxID=714136 RepID=A0A7W8A5B3_9ACTN|nr:GNAT family N-acetyltransferase [Nonomuraea endophytica]MBB5079145.1 ribosomal protein S18 acetylase RimI-like enzyme [Nonomuraea endophytica]